jgi:hypothetical protein
VRRRFAKEGGKDREKIIPLYALANRLFEQGEFLKAEKIYNEILITISQLEIEERIKAEKRMKK